MALRLICDEMLQGLGRWLRAAGYDTLIAANGESDRALLELAKTSGRWLITRDRALGSGAAGMANVVILESDGIDACVAELNRRLQLNWNVAPFSRCMVCNTPLVEADESQRRDIPSDVVSDQALFCRQCNKVYWEGGHVRRMRSRLNSFARM